MDSITRQYIAEYQKQQRSYEINTRPIFLRLLNYQIQPIIGALEAGVLQPDPNILIPNGSFVQPIINTYINVGLLAAKREYFYQRRMDGEEQKASIIDLFTNVWTALFREYSTRYAYRIDNEFTEVTRQSVRKILQEAYEEGLNADKIITKLKRAIGATNRHRATNIARTETTTAANYAKEVGARQWLSDTNQQGYKGWLARVDERTRQAHLIENNTYIPIDEKFILEDPKVGRVECERPGDLVLPASQRCMCRCTVTYLSEGRYRRLLASGRV